MDKVPKHKVQIVPEHKVHIVLNEGLYAFDQSAINTKAKDKVMFVNDTDNSVKILLSSRTVLDSPDFYLDSKGDKTLVVIDGPSKTNVDCMVDPDTSGGIVAMATKPTIIVNRD